MYNSGDAAEQVVRISLEGLEYTIKLAGAGAKQIAAFLVAAFKSDDTAKTNKTKLRGKARLTEMLKSGQPLKIFGVKNSDLEQFQKEAKRYGVRYCALRDKHAKKDDLIDIMVKVEDSPKLDRILERLEFMSVDRASVESDLAEGKEQEAPDIDDTDKLVDLMIDDEGKPVEESPTKQAAQEAGENSQSAPERSEPIENPTKAKTDRGVPSEPISNSPLRTENTGQTPNEQKPSVEKFLRESAARKKQEEKAKTTPPVGERPRQPQKQTQHIQPQGKRNKFKKSKERN